MKGPQFCIKHLRDTLSDNSLRHALDVLADATSASVVLFDNDGQVAAGPVAGNDLIRRVLSTPQGRELVISTHRDTANRAAGKSPPGEPPSGTNALTAAPLERFGIPICRSSQCAGMLTLGDRSRTPLSQEAISRIESAAGLPAGELRQAAASLKPWSPAEASAARNMAGLFAELLAELCLHEMSLSRRIEELTAVYNIASLLSGTMDLQEVLNRTARTVCEVMRVKACSIRLLDETSGNLVIRAVHNLSEEYLNKGAVTVEENPIDRAAMRGEVVYIADAPTDPRTRYPQEARREGIVSGLVVGLIYRGKTVGVLRVYTGEPHVFTPFEAALLQAVASQAAAAIVNVRLMAETLEAERYSRQITYAGEVQRRMIPSQPPVCRQVEIGAVYRPTYNVGGDFYDFIPLPNGNLGIAISDVSGKGVPASLVMASLRSALRVYAKFTYDIDHIMAMLNKHVCAETKIGEFTTLFYGVLSPDGRRLTYCNAGHEPPMLLRNGQIQPLGTGGMVLGIDETARFERELVSLQPGDVVLLYTDGAAEALNFSDEQYGRPRLGESLIRYADQPAQLIAQNILWDIRRFRGLADRIDDVTLVVLKIKDTAKQGPPGPDSTVQESRPPAAPSI
ncbi:MAG TPA: SpoIIE family protein phosphatase [Phycisphaerae bacterium]|nr:SpoIIE family protein phosphatase [Phycisphaerae bacterium]HRR86119.1 SpoIIE family protein phosphatase [Phycisphaerae bacterium]